MVYYRRLSLAQIIYKEITEILMNNELERMLNYTVTFMGALKNTTKNRDYSRPVSGTPLCENRLRFIRNKTGPDINLSKKFRFITNRTGHKYICPRSSVL